MLRQSDERFIEWPRKCFSFREGFNLSTCQFFRRQKYTELYIHVYLRGFKINRKVAWQRIQKSMRSIEEHVIPLSNCSIFMVFYGHHWDIEKKRIVSYYSYIFIYETLGTPLNNFKIKRVAKFYVYYVLEIYCEICLLLSSVKSSLKLVDRQFSNSITNVSSNIRTCIWIIRNVRIFTNVW